ncbi:MAG: tryptophan-rich sensory protein [Alistipes senegalensis]|nr:tryptophan-rich sensory protein [Bacteroides cellulosilyticus]MCM1352682.1 tryptophan-rich sensory protein [Alistipes senegalensis]
MKKIHCYLLPLLLCFALGGVASLLQTDALREWYPYLAKPALTPPAIVFPIAWSILYACIGISAGLVLSTCTVKRHAAMIFWYLQLALNFLWSILFFTLRNPTLALIDIAVLDILVVLYIVFSARVRRAAAWLFVPYLCWILFATYLNAYIQIAN